MTSFQDKKKRSLFWLTETLLKTVVLLLPVFIVVYVAVNLYLANDYRGYYSFNFNIDAFNRIYDHFYSTDTPDGYKIKNFERINDKSYAAIGLPPFNFSVRPEYFPLHGQLSISATISGSADWFVSLVCQSCAKDKRYDWQPLYYGDLSDYRLAAQFGDLRIYALQTKKWSKTANLDEWIAKNIPIGSHIKIIDDAYPLTKIVNQQIDFVENSITEIKHRMRGAVTFYVYLKDSLELKIKKTDLNWYEGDDAVTIKLSDLNGKTWCQETLADDGIAISRSEVEIDPVEKKIICPLSEAGIYKLSFDSVDRKQTDDWLITQMVVNTNKIVFSEDNHLILDPAKLYAEITDPTDINFFVWHPTAVQQIKFDGRYNKKSATLKIGENQLDFWRKIRLEPDVYEISVHGDQFMNGDIMALDPKNYFRPFSYRVNQDESPSFILVKNYDFKKNQDGWITVTQTFDLAKSAAIKSLKNIDFALTSHDLIRCFNEENKMYEQNFYPLASNPKFQLWTKAENQTATSSAEPAIWIENLPHGATININSLSFVGDDVLNLLPYNSTGRIKDDNRSAADFILKKNACRLNAAIMDINIVIR